MTKGTVFCIALLVAGPALATTPQVGEPAPELGNSSWVMNQPNETSIQRLKGQVIFIEKWGVRCPPCVALIPHIEKLQRTYANRGLHIFAFEAQGHTPDQIKAKIAEKGGKTYPVSAGGGDNYRGDGRIPVAWLIGVRGTVIWQGNPAAETERVDALIEQEIAKIRFPGLGRTDFDKAVSKAVTAYKKKDLGKARARAQKVADNEKASQTARADGKYIVDKVNELIERHWKLLEVAQAEKDYLEAFEILNWMQAKFKRDEAGKRAKGILARLKKDKAIKNELAAASKLEKLLAKLLGQPRDVKAATLMKFAKGKRVAGTQAAARAESMAR